MSVFSFFLLRINLINIVIKLIVNFFLIGDRKFIESTYISSLFFFVVMCVNLLPSSTLFYTSPFTITVCGESVDQKRYDNNSNGENVLVVVVVKK